MTLSTFNVVRLFFLLHSYIRTYLVLFIRATLNLQRKKNLNEVFREKFCVAWHLGYYYGVFEYLNLCVSFIEFHHTVHRHIVIQY